jgi:hypothetical protein
MAIKHRPDSLRNIALAKRGIDPPDDWTDLSQVRAAKKAEIGQACSAAIFAGVTVGGKNYSLADRDQQNINFLFTQALQDTAVSYHADGELCRTYPPDEFALIGAAAASHVTFHTTLINHYNRWLDGMDDIDAIAAVTYSPERNGADLPQELFENFAHVISMVRENESD